MDGIPALDFWDMGIEVWHSSLNQPSIQGSLCDNGQSRKRTNTRTKKHSNRDDLNNVDHVTTQAKLSHFGAVLYIFEDNEAVIKMIIKGRSPTMRQVSRTLRVARLLDRINLDPKLQIEHIDNKNQLPDVLTKNGLVFSACSTS